MQARAQNISKLVLYTDSMFTINGKPSRTEKENRPFFLEEVVS